MYCVFIRSVNIFILHIYEGTLKGIANATYKTVVELTFLQHLSILFVIRTYSKVRLDLSTYCLFTSHMKLTSNRYFNSGKKEYRAVITFFVLKGSLTTEIHTEQIQVYGKFFGIIKEFCLSNFFRGKNN